MMDDLYNNLGNKANPPRLDKKEHKTEDKKEDKKENKKENKKEHKKNDKKEHKKEHESENKKKKNDKVSVPKDKNDLKTTAKGLYGNAKKPKIEKLEVDINYEDDKLNYSPFEKAKELDKRSFFATYWSLLKFKQTIIFTFYTSSIGILRSTKIALFILFVGFYMAFTALFFNDEIMRNIYIYKGNTNAAVHVPNIILSSLCSFIASIIVRFICLGERDISKVIVEKNIEKRKALAEKAKKCANIKIIILYIASGCLLILCWYYVSAFCAVFKNSQKNYLINTLISFIVCNLWPFVTTFIPTIMRRKAIEKKSATLYKSSQYVF